jgi:hypothetical protein
VNNPKNQSDAWLALHRVAGQPTSEKAATTVR